MAKHYKLQKYSGIASRHQCPSCGRKHCFTLYVDEEGKPLDESVGRCDHESSCGYNYTPKEYFRDHPPIELPKYQPKQSPNYIPYKYVRKSVRFDIDSDFTRFLHTILDPLIVEGLTDEYKLGVTKAGDVIFFQIDRNGKCRTGKIMKYDPETGHRIKDENVGGRINWVHSLLKRMHRLPYKWELRQCLFGEHLLREFPDKTVALVESEKTAVICAGMMPQYIWLATGGKSQFNERLNVLKGRKVVAFPDVDGYEEWRKKSASMPELNIAVSDLLERMATPEDRQNHVDIADILIKELLHPEPTIAQILATLPKEAQLLIEDLGLEVVDDWQF